MIMVSVARSLTRRGDVRQPRRCGRGKRSEVKKILRARVRRGDACVSVVLRVCENDDAVLLG